jgi:hypothetical protein
MYYRMYLQIMGVNCFVIIFTGKCRQCRDLNTRHLKPLQNRTSLCPIFEWFGVQVPGHKKQLGQEDTTKLDYYTKTGHIFLLNCLAYWNHLKIGLVLLKDDLTAILF